MNELLQFGLIIQGKCHTTAPVVKSPQRTMAEETTTTTIHHRVVYVPACSPEEFEAMRQRIKYIGREVENMVGILQDMQADRERGRREAWQQWCVLPSFFCL